MNPLGVLGSGITRMINHGLGGEPDEALSARAHVEWPRTRRIINALFFWQRDHCGDAARRHKARATATLEKYRNV